MSDCPRSHSWKEAEQGQVQVKHGPKPLTFPALVQPYLDKQIDLRQFGPEARQARVTVGSDLCRILWTHASDPLLWTEALPSALGGGGLEHRVWQKRSRVDEPWPDLEVFPEVHGF